METRKRCLAETVPYRNFKGLRYDHERSLLSVSSEHFTENKFTEAFSPPHIKMAPWEITYSISHRAWNYPKMEVSSKDCPLNQQIGAIIAVNL